MTEQHWQVLAVDDEAGVCELLQRLLARDGHQVTAAGSGAEAMGLIRQHRYDLLLVDKNMPAPDGVEVAFFARRTLPTAVIVMLTGFPSLQTAECLIGLADEYVPKPFNVAELVPALNALMARQQAYLRAWASGTTPAIGRATPVPRAGHKWWVVSPEAKDRTAVASAARRLGIVVEEASALAAVAQGPLPDVLVIDAELCAFPTRMEIWRLQAESPAMSVVLLAAPGSTDHAIAAVALRALVRLNRPLDEQDAFTTFSQLA